MQIKMFSDTICGWCYIGKERLNQAIEQLNLSQSIVMNLPFSIKSINAKGWNGSY